MAVTKIWDVRGRIETPMEYIKNPDKTENPLMKKGDEDTINDVIAYAANEDKTEMRMYVSAINCNTTCAARQFTSVKKQFGKEGGIIAFHGYQSFAPGETTPEQAHEIGVKLAEELWGDRFQVVVATHLNTNCLHNHFLINSVSFMDGKRYHDCKDTYRKMQDVSDRLCREYSLSVVENKGRGSEPIYMAHKSAEGKATRYNMTRDAVDEAIKSSRSVYEFEKRLHSLGYKTQCYENRKYWTVTPKGSERPIRLARLGKEYTNGRIYERIHDNNYVPFETIQKRRYKQYNLPTRWDKIKKVKGVKGTYLRYCYLLGYLPKYKQNPNRVYYLLKDELLKCEKYSEQIRLMSRYNLTTTEDVINFIEGRKDEMNVLSEERDKLRKEVKRRNIPEDELEKKKARIKDITSELSKLRKEVRLAEDIPERGEKMKEKMNEIEKAERRKERTR